MILIHTPCSSTNSNFRHAVFLTSRAYTHPPRLLCRCPRASPSRKRLPLLITTSSRWVDCGSVGGEGRGSAWRRHEHRIPREASSWLILMAHPHGSHASPNQYSLIEKSFQATRWRTITMTTAHEGGARSHLRRPKTTCWLQTTFWTVLPFWTKLPQRASPHMTAITNACLLHSFECTYTHMWAHTHTHTHADVAAHLPAAGCEP